MNCCVEFLYSKLTEHGSIMNVEEYQGKYVGGEILRTPMGQICYYFFFFNSFLAMLV